METFTTNTGRKLRVHNRADCRGERCVIHKPSSHHMRDWPLIWRDDRGCFERICPCGVGHPDPDDLNHDGIHGCCGCCDLTMKLANGSTIQVKEVGSGKIRGLSQ